MAFDRDGWNVVGGVSKKGTGLGVFSYSTTDTIAQVNNEGYFNDLSDTVSVGDIIFARTSTGGTQAVSICFVASNTAAGVVDVTDGLTVTATDSD
ncbi:MAG: hypothetical protein GOVbin1230_37 [Prokaryotic dsDNA virus sp.]|nr:MAG: hypothetical protein GOVbin1230_37 [Prokaryotic dsDNA virus sp.]|tara:strand:+ start:63 stop:347 length:285 start_codon:yes stop_codon:yes gene_type:complete